LDEENIWLVHLYVNKKVLTRYSQNREGMESGLVFLHLHLEIRVSATSKEIRISDFGMRNNFTDAEFEKGGISLNSKLTTDRPVLEIRHPGLAESLIAKS
jgi:hypothetical protein